MNDPPAPQQEPPLVLDQEGLADRSIAFFTRLNADEGLRTEFVADPIGTIEREVYGRGDPGEREATLNQANRILLSLLSNERFMAWARDYDATVDPATSKEEVHQAIIRAAVEHGDKELLTSMAARVSDVPLGRGVSVADDTATLNLFCVLDCSPVVAFQANTTVSGDTRLRQALSREDIATVARLFAEDIPQRAAALRDQGVLASPDSAHLDRTLSTRRQT